MIAYKFLARGAIGRFSDFPWPRSGEWVESAQPVDECRNGIHALAFEAELLDWIDDELWRVELDEVVTVRGGVVVSARGRLVERVEGWDEEAARTFTAACALRYAGTVARELRAAGDEQGAALFDRAATLTELQLAALETRAAHPQAPLAEVIAFAADLASLASGSRPDTWLHTGAAVREAPSAGAVAANTAFVAAHATGVAGGGAGAQYAAEFAAERLRQFEGFRLLVDR